MHKPWHTLIFAIVLFSAMGLLALLIPEDGLFLPGNFRITYPRLADLVNSGEKRDIREILRAVEAADTSFVVIDSAEAVAPAPPPPPEKSKAPLQSGIQYRDPSVLSGFFNALDNLKKDPSAIRVLHYGDSQIEGDRMTEYLRAKLQEQFGGSGVGLLSLMPLTNSPACRIDFSHGWDRYNVFVSKDKRVAHKNYGVLGGFCRFREYDQPGPVAEEGPFEIVIRNARSAAVPEKIKLFYGGAREKTWCEFYEGPALMNADSLATGGMFNVAEYPAGSGGLPLTFRFSGADSPDFYGLSLESSKGVMVDNIAMRGSSGTFFHQINPVQLRKFYSYLNVKMIILQFGGNTVPSIRDSAMAANFGNYIRYQISLVRKLAPDASILFIGPSDMSIREGTDYVTHPFLEPVRDVVKKSAIEGDCAFFDIYDCMGGRNSMPAWVEEKLAASDYTHFSPRGARKIATILYGALIAEYNNHIKNKY